MEDKDLITLTETVARSKSNSHQIDEVKDEIKEIRNEQKAIYTIATSVELIAKDMSSMKESLIEVKQGQKDLTYKMDEQITDVKEKIEKVDQKGKLDVWSDLIKPKIIPVIFGGGCLYVIAEIIKLFVK